MSIYKFAIEINNSMGYKESDIDTLVADALFDKLGIEVINIGEHILLNDEEAVEYYTCEDCRYHWVYGEPYEIDNCPCCKGSNTSFEEITRNEVREREKLTKT